VVYDKIGYLNLVPFELSPFAHTQTYIFLTAIFQVNLGQPVAPLTLNLHFSFYNVDGIPVYADLILVKNTTTIVKFMWLYKQLMLK